MNDQPHFEHPDYPESRPFNPFGEEEPVEPNDSNETSQSLRSDYQNTLDALTDTGDQQGECDHNEMVRDPVGKYGYWMCAKCFRPYGQPQI